MRFGERGHHVAQQGAAAQLLGPILHAAIGDHRAGEHLAAFALALRLRFAGEVALICPAAAGGDNAVGGNALAVVGAQNIADLHLIKRQALPMAVALHAHLRRRELEQQPQAVEALLFGTLLQIFAEAHKADNHYAGFEIHMRHAVVA